MSDTGQQGQHGELWSVLEGYQEVRILDASRAIIFCEPTEPDEEGNERQGPRMDRAVACVNGCAGINPAAVKELLAACCKVLAWFDSYDIGSFYDTPCYSEYEAVRAAIAKAEEKERAK